LIDWFARVAGLYGSRQAAVMQRANRAAARALRQSCFAEGLARLIADIQAQR